MKKSVSNDPSSIHGNVITHIIHVNVHQSGKSTEQLLEQLGGEDVRQCDICSNALGKHFIIEKHNYFYASTQPYMCGICGETCEHGYLLKIHLEIEHGFTEDKGQRSVPKIKKKLRKDANQEKESSEGISGAESIHSENEYGENRCGADSYTCRTSSFCNKAKGGTESNKGSTDKDIERENVVTEADVKEHDLEKDVGQGQKLIQGDGGDLIVINVITENNSLNKSKKSKVAGKKSQSKKSVQCTYCDEKFSSSQSMLRHCRNLHPGEYSSCSLCEKTFNSRKEVKIHEKEHFSKPKEDHENQPNKDSVAEKLPLFCNICKRTFTTGSGLQIHMQNLHPETITKTKTFCCEKCGNMFWTKHALVEHFKIHREIKPFKCSGCSKAFRRKSDMTAHARVHTGEKPFVCSFCQRRFRQKAQLQSHIRTHTGEKPYKCEFCSKCFAKRDQYCRHRRIHTKEKPFQCEHCQKSFKSSANLKTHTRVHTGEKPFKCSHCPQSFAQFANLKHHERLHTGEKPYSCNICEKRFGRSNNLKAHMKVHTREPGVRIAKPTVEKVLKTKSPAKAQNVSNWKHTDVLLKPQDPQNSQDSMKSQDLPKPHASLKSHLTHLPATVYLPIQAPNQLMVSSHPSTGILTLGPLNNFLNFANNAINSQFLGTLGNVNSSLVSAGPNLNVSSGSGTQGTRKRGSELLIGSLPASVPQRGNEDIVLSAQQTQCITTPSSNEIIAAALHASNIVPNNSEVTINPSNFVFTPISESDPSILVESSTSSALSDSNFPPPGKGVSHVSRTDAQNTASIQACNILSQMISPSLTETLPTPFQISPSSIVPASENMAAVLSSLKNLSGIQ